MPPDKQSCPDGKVGRVSEIQVRMELIFNSMSGVNLGRNMNREYGVSFFQTFECELDLDVIIGRRIETSSDCEAYGRQKCNY